MRHEQLSKVISSMAHIMACIGVGLVAATSCVMEDMPDSAAPEEQDVYIPLSISVPGSEVAGLRSLGTKDETAIDKDGLQVLVFNAADRYQYKARIDTRDWVDGAENRTVYVELKRSTTDEYYYLVVLANTASKTIKEGITKKEVLEQYVFDVPSKGYPSAAGTRLPMWGKSVSRIINDETNFGAIGLERSVARVDVGVNFVRNAAGEIEENATAQGLGNFALNQIYLYNSLNKGYVAPLRTNDEGKVLSIPEDAKVFTPNFTGYTVTDGKRSMREIYLAEANNHRDGGVSNTWQMERCCLVVGGKYNGAANPTYYRIDFYKDQTNPEATLMDIQRNYRYVFNITGVQGPGYPTPDEAYRNKSVNMTVQIMIWTDNQFDYVDYTGQDNFYNETKTIILGYAAGSQQKINVKSSVPSSEWRFVGNDGMDVAGTTYNNGEVQVTIPANLSADTVGQITFKALKDGALTGGKTSTVVLRVRNMRITYIVSQTGTMNFDPSLQPSGDGGTIDVVM